MKKLKLLLLMLLLVLSSGGFALTEQSESLLAILKTAREDTVKVNTLIALSGSLISSNPEYSLRYANEAKALADKLGFKPGQAYALKSIGRVYYFQGDYIGALPYWQQSLNIFRSIGDKKGIANMLSNLGVVNFNEGDDAKAIEYYLEALGISEEIGDKLRTATVLVNIGAVYFNKKATHERALQYYLKALPLSEELGNNEAIGTSAVNIGEIYLARGDNKSALVYFERALKAYNKSENGNVPYALYNIGRVYTQRKEFLKAIKYQQDAYNLANKLNKKLEMSQASLGLAETYRQQGDNIASISTFIRAQNIAKEIGASYELKTAYEGLAEMYNKVSDYRNAYKYQTLFSTIKDTLYNAEMDKKNQVVTLNFDLQKKQGEVDLLTKDKALQELDLQRQKTIRNATSITGILLLLLALGLYKNYRYVRKTKKIIENEKERSEKLLLNILPFEIAEELKEKGSATPKQYDLVSVLFTDFKGFTSIAEKHSPEQLVEELNQCFLEFDLIIDKYNLEKIKTIGDSYMCAGGIPVVNSSNPIDAVMAGIEIQAYMERIKAERIAKGLDYWELRIGINTGKIIAGVVGKNKFAYDIWGDAVNVASRMESSGAPGKVNISGSTYELVKDLFTCEYRGKVKAKNKGEIDMYFVEA
ncbi:MAG: adenylate/guanylate cyclase domain-containing protein [Bacteroidales bacterium]|nr:adenylate/guanylate cyclase domain-containing protein [Bacteroidales bacterium]